MIANLLRFFAAVPALTIALTHAGTCPACWPLIGGLVSSLGLTFTCRNPVSASAHDRMPRDGHRCAGLRCTTRLPAVDCGGCSSWRNLDWEIHPRHSLVTLAGACLLVAAYLWSFWLRRPGTASGQSCCAPTSIEEGAVPEKMTNNLPIACALNQAQFAVRMELVKRLVQEAKECRKLPHGVGLSFEPVSRRVSELAKLVDLERACCPFLTFRIEASAGKPVWLELTGPPAAQEIIRELIPEIASND
jgi:hypothetical protein